ncbi:MAG TPA: hypothetical protein VIY28_07695 [Pseudonocardiaceae bacterium]
MSEPTADALSGVDGTQSPEPLPDPSNGRGAWGDAPDLPPISLPPLPDASVMREAIAAALAGDPSSMPDQAPTAPPVAQPATPPPAPSQGGLPPTGPAPRRPPRLPVSGPVTSAQSQPRKPAGWRYRPPLAAAFREPVPLGDFRRRIARERAVPRRQSRSGVSPGARIVIIILLIIFWVLVYKVATGIMETVSHLIP